MLYTFAEVTNRFKLISMISDENLLQIIPTKIKALLIILCLFVFVCGLYSVLA